MDSSGGLAINDLDHPSDIKVPWELSRLQWLLPVGQRYVLSRNDDDATFTREIIEEWLSANPVCRGPNWICAMDVAIRAISMVWLFHACKDSPAWRDRIFLERFAKSLLVHGRFIEGNLEYSDVNGNHLTADLAGLTVIGVALGGQGMAEKWISLAWDALCTELLEQVPADGVCREGSLPYHRLVAELFLIPALARQNVGLHVETDYIDRLRKMSEVVTAATVSNGTVPVWGDADDGRGLPLGGQDINDHRYLAEILDHFPKSPARPTHEETLWWMGPGTVKNSATTTPSSKSFVHAGVYILRDDKIRVFVDAGPVGMGGRGGHGHNDCLSIDVCVNGESLIVDPGSYVYTPDWQARNRYRSTAAHNTPQIDGQEINRYTHPRHLWRLHDDAVPTVRHWSTGADIDVLVADHSGYRRLASPVTPVRGIMLDKMTGNIIIADGFEGDGDHDIRIPFMLAPDVSVEQLAAGILRLSAPNAQFLFVQAFPEAWDADIEPANVSPCYGVEQNSHAIVFHRRAALLPSAVAIIANEDAPADPQRWLRQLIDGRFPVPGLS